MYGYILTYSGFKGRTFKLCVLTKWDFNFCVRSSHCGWSRPCTYQTLVQCFNLIEDERIKKCFFLFVCLFVLHCSTENSQTTSLKLCPIISILITLTLRPQGRRRGKTKSWIFRQYFHSTKFKLCTVELRYTKLTFMKKKKKKKKRLCFRKERKKKKKLLQNYETNSIESLLVVTFMIPT